MEIYILQIMHTEQFIVIIDFYSRDALHDLPIQRHLHSLLQHRTVVISQLGAESAQTSPFAQNNLAQLK